MLLREEKKGVLQSSQTDDDFVNFLAHVEAKVERDLIVLRAVCNFAPAGPIRFVSVASMFMWTSSSDSSQTNLPSLISVSISRKPRAIISNSLADKIPAAARAEAWAMDPAISWR